MSERAIKAGRAAIELFLDDKGITRQINQTRRRLTSMGQTLLGVGTQLTVLGGAISGPFALAIKYASDLQETTSKFDVVFNRQAGAVRAWADEYGRSVGRSKQQVLEFLASTQDLLVPIGIDPAQATGLSQQVTKLAVDLASFNNAVDADALRDLQAALTGESEPMKKYGVIVNEAAVNMELLNRAIDPSRATQSEKVFARLAIIMRGTAAAQGDAARTSDSFANSMKALQAELANTGAEVGSAVLPAVSQFVQMTRQALQPVAEFARANQESVVAIGATGVAMVALGLTVTTAGAAVAALATGFTAIATAVGLIGAPAAAVGLAIAGVTVATTDWSRAFEELQETGTNAIKGIQAALKAGNIELAVQVAEQGASVAIGQRLEEIARNLGLEATADIINAAWTDDAVKMNNLRQQAQLAAEAVEDVKKAADGGSPASVTAVGNMSEMVKLEQEAQRLMDETRSAAEKRAQQIQRLDEMLRSGVISEETYQRALQKTNEEFERSDKATQDRIRKQEELKRKREESRKAMEDEAQAIRESLRTPEQQFDVQVDRLRKLRDAGLLSRDEFDQAREAERRRVTAEADALRDTLKTPQDKFDEFRKRVEDFGAKGFLNRDEIKQLIAGARAELERGRATIAPRQVDPVFADAARFGFGAVDIQRSQLAEQQRIRRATEQTARQRAPRVGR